MAKNTQHKALASLGRKFQMLARKYNDLRGWYEHVRKANSALEAALSLVETNAARRLNNKDVALKNVEGQLARTQQELAALRHEVNNGRMVPYRQHQQVTDELGYANKQVKNLQNRNAELRNKVESAVQGGIIYGTLVAVAAYAAGIATQHWFPIAF